MQSPGWGLSTLFCKSRSAPQVGVKTMLHCRPDDLTMMHYILEAWLPCTRYVICNHGSDCNVIFCTSVHSQIYCILAQRRCYYVDLWFNIITCRSVLVFPNGGLCNITKNRILTIFQIDLLCINLSGKTRFRLIACHFLKASAMINVINFD